MKKMKKPRKEGTTELSKADRLDWVDDGVHDTR